MKSKISKVTMIQRLASLLGKKITVDTIGSAGNTTGKLVEIGEDFLVIDESGERVGAPANQTFQLCNITKFHN